MGQVRSVEGAGGNHGIVYSLREARPYPFMDEGNHTVLKATVAYCLMYQEAHVLRHRIPATMPWGIHAMCKPDGTLRFVDVGNFPPLLDECEPSLLKRYIVKGLARLIHETAFSGKAWKNLETEEACLALEKRLDALADMLPRWYVALLHKVLSMPGTSFRAPATYVRLRDKYGLSQPNSRLPLEKPASATSGLFPCFRPTDVWRHTRTSPRVPKPKWTSSPSAQSPTRPCRCFSPCLCSDSTGTSFQGWILSHDWGKDFSSSLGSRQHVPTRNPKSKRQPPQRPCNSQRKTPLRTPSHSLPDYVRI